MPPPPTSTLFPYTTLFRSPADLGVEALVLRGGDVAAATLDDQLDLQAALLVQGRDVQIGVEREGDRKSTRLNSSHVATSYAVFCLKKKTYSDPSGCTARPT